MLVKKLFLVRFIFVICAMLLLASPAWALDLKDAKAQGLVGEQLNGYLGIIKSSAAVNALVGDINSKRKAMYEKIAKRNGTSVSAVEILAGKKATEKTPAGQYVQSPSGAWQRK
jgi:uncharacterized protein YdbL (DUF1318 family)